MEIVIHVVAWMVFVGIIGLFVSGAMKKFPQATPAVIVAGAVSIVGYAIWLAFG